MPERRNKPRQITDEIIGGINNNIIQVAFPPGGKEKQDKRERKMNDEKDFLDEEEFEEGDEEIITLATPDGEEVDFTQIATVEFEGNLYVIMQPVELFEGMDEDEALVFSVTDEGEEDSRFDVVTDERVIDGVFGEYNKLFEEQNKN